MNTAASARRITLGILAGAALAAGVLWMRPGSVDQPGELSPQKMARRVSMLPALSGKDASPGQAVPDGRFRVTVQLRLMASSAGSPQAGVDAAASMVSPPALLSVVHTLGLAGRWSVDAGAAAANLKAMVEAHPSNEKIPMITLRVTAAGSHEAFEIADTLVSGFKAGVEAVETDRTRRIAGPVYRRIKELTDAVERTRMEMLECMNRQGVVDYAFLEQLNGGPGVIQPDLDASLFPDVKLAWFRGQLEMLNTRPPDELTDLLAGAVLPFEDPVSKECQVWLELVPIAREVEGAQSPPNDGPARVSLEFMREQAAEAVERYKQKLSAWLEQAERELSASGDAGMAAGTAADRMRQGEYSNLKARYESQAEMLKTMQGHAANLFGDDASIYVPPAVVLRRTVERLRP